jgi:hypothetical protein
MQEQPSASALVLGITLAIGLAISGLLIGRGLYRARAADRFVTVRGLVERDVTADLAVWTLGFTATDNDIAKASAKIDADTRTVTAFLQGEGFSAAEIQPQGTRVIDRMAQEYGREKEIGTRYVVQSSIRVRTGNVERVDRSTRDTGQLIAKGVVLDSGGRESGSVNPAFFFTQLNSIRPAMIADATRSARAVAIQFAADSGSKLGAIRKANQGVFEITARDATESQNQYETTIQEQGSIQKKVRLVSTIDYLLTD